MPLSEYRRRLDGLDKPKWDKRSPIVLTAEADRSFALQFKLEVRPHLQSRRRWEALGVRRGGETGEYRHASSTTEQSAPCFILGD